MINIIRSSNQKNFYKYILNNNHPLAAGLEVCYPIISKRGSILVDVCGNWNGIIGSSLSWSRGEQYIKGSAAPDVNGYISTTHKPNTYMWEGITIIIELIWKTTAPHVYPGLVTNMAYGNYYGNFSLIGGSSDSIVWYPGLKGSILCELTGLQQNEKMIIAVTWNSKTKIANFYKNLSLVDTDYITGSFTSNIYNTQIMGYYRGGICRNFEGEIKRVYIYNKELNYSAIKELYIKPYCIFFNPSLLSFLFDSDENYTVYDYCNFDDSINITDITETVDRYRLDRSKEDAIYDWAVASLGSNITIIWDKPDEDRPQLPYVTLNIMGGPIQLGDRPASKYKSLDTWVYQFKYRMTLSVNVIGYSKHQEMMATLLRSLHLPSKVLILNSSGLANWGYDGPRDLSTFVDNEWEFRSQADIFLSYGEDVEDVTGEIQKLEVNGQIIEIP